MSDDLVSIKIAGRSVIGWTDVTICRSVDAFSSVTLSAPFDAARADLRGLFRPFQFQDLVVSIDGETIFTGMVVDVAPRVDENGSTVAVTGYSLPAALQDCTEPTAALPLEMRDVDLGAVFSKVLEPLGLRFEIKGSTGAPFEKLGVEKTEKPHDTIARLANLRGFVLSDTADGRMLCWRSEVGGQPVVRLREGVPPLGSVDAKFSARDYYSELTGYAPARRGRRGDHHTERNPFLARLRPFAFEVEEADPADAPEAVRAKMGRMFGNMAAWDVDDIPTWRDPSGALWAPNTCVTMHAPSAMIYVETKLLVRTVELHATAKKRWTKMELVMLGAFSGAAPERLPWDE